MDKARADHELPLNNNQTEFMLLVNKLDVLEKMSTKLMLPI